MIRFFFSYHVINKKPYNTLANSPNWNLTVSLLRKPAYFDWNFLTNKYLTHVGELRPYYIKQLSYQYPLKFLNKRLGSTHKLSSQLMRKGKLLIWYKFFRKYYIQLLRTNFLPFYLSKYSKYKFITKNISFYWTMYYFYNAIKDFDRVILWRLFQVNSLFRFKLGIYRKKGKKKQELNLTFVVRSQRIYVAWKWLTFYLLSVGTDIRAPRNILIALDNYILQPPKVQALTLFKYEVYRAQLLRMV